MSSKYSNIDISRCMKSEEPILNYFRGSLCFNCQKIPLPSIIDSLKENRIYCQDCFASLGLKTKIRQKREEIKFLEKLKIDCKNSCGLTFSYYNLEELENHEVTCELKNCDRCNSKQTKLNHDCVVILNQKIVDLEKSLNLLANKTESKFSELKSQNELILKAIESQQKQSELNLAKIEELHAKPFNPMFDLGKQKKSELLSSLTEKITFFESEVTKVTNFNELIKSDTFNNTLSEVKRFQDSMVSLDDQEALVNKFQILSKKLHISLMKPINGNIFSRIKGENNNEILCMIIYNKNILITGSLESIKFWDINSQKCICTMNNAHDSWIHSLIILKNTNTLVSGSQDRKIKFWNIDIMKESSREINNYSEVNCLIEFNRNTIVVGSNDKSINYFDINTKELKMKIKTLHLFSIYKLLLINSQNKDYILSGSYDKTIKVWDKDKCINSLDNHTGLIMSLIQLEFDPNILVSADFKCNINFWRINEKYKLVRHFKHTDYLADCVNDKCFVSLFEIKILNVLISTTSLSTLTFWNLQNFEIIRNINLSSGLINVIGLENDEGIIFNLISDIIVWK